MSTEYNCATIVGTTSEPHFFFHCVMPIFSPVPFDTRSCTFLATSHLPALSVPAPSVLRHVPLAFRLCTASLVQLPSTPASPTIGAAYVCVYPRFTRFAKSSRAQLSSAPLTQLHLGSIGLDCSHAQPHSFVLWFLLPRLLRLLSVLVVGGRFLVPTAVSHTRLLDPSSVLCPAKVRSFLVITLSPS